MESELVDEELSGLEESPRPARVLDREPIRDPPRALGARSPLCLPPDATLAEAVRLMREHHVGCILAVEDERLVGILTERDLLLKLEGGDLSRPVRDLMTSNPEVLHPEDPIVYALHRMSVGGAPHRPPGGRAGRPG